MSRAGHLLCHSCAGATWTIRCSLHTNHAAQGRVPVARCGPVPSQARNPWLPPAAHGWPPHEYCTQSPAAGSVRAGAVEQLDKDRHTAGMGASDKQGHAAQPRCTTQPVACHALPAATACTACQASAGTGPPPAAGTGGMLFDCISISVTRGPQCGAGRYFASNWSLSHSSPGRMRTCVASMGVCSMMACLTRQCLSVARSSTAGSRV